MQRVIDVDWHEVLRRARIIALYFDHYEPCRIDLNRLLEERCNDVTMINRLIDIYAHWSVQSLNTDSAICSWHRNQLLTLLSEDRGIFLTVKRRETISVHAISTCDAKFVKVLIKYGFYKLPDRSPKMEGRPFLRRELKDQFGFTADEAVPVELDVSYDENWVISKQPYAIPFTQELEKLSDRKMPPTAKGFRRVVEIIRLLRNMALVTLGVVRQVDYVECTRAHFEAISEPYVTLPELEFFLFCLQKERRYEEVGIMDRRAPSLFSLCLWNSDSFLLSDVGIQEALREYSRLFGNVCEKPCQPRSLRHLGCLSVRHAICLDKGVFPEMVESLHIPKVLKELIIGD